MPAWRVTLDSRAEAEAREAFSWYLEQDPDVAFRFQAALTRAIDSIAEAPLRWPEIEPRIRRRLVHRFPYSVLYAVTGDRVTVLSIVHQKRSPDSWRSRR